MSNTNLNDMMAMHDTNGMVHQNHQHQQHEQQHHQQHADYTGNVSDSTTDPMNYDGDRRHGHVSSGDETSRLISPLQDKEDANQEVEKVSSSDRGSPASLRSPTQDAFDTENSQVPDTAATPKPKTQQTKDKKNTGKGKLSATATASPSPNGSAPSPPSASNTPAKDSPKSSSKARRRKKN
jgi:hypothetical protein